MRYVDFEIEIYFFSIGKEYNPVLDTKTLEKPNDVNIKSNSILLFAA